MENHLAKLYNAVSAPVTTTRDALAERLQSVRDIISLLYNRMMENMGYGQQETLKDIVEKEAEDNKRLWLHEYLGLKSRFCYCIVS